MNIQNTIYLKKAVNYLAKNDGKNLATLKRHLPAVIGVWMTSFYLLNNLKSDKIPENRKPALFLNDVITCAFGVGGGYLLSDAIFKFKDALVDRFAKVVAKNPEKVVLTKGLSSFIPLLAFAFMFRYIGPVVATPLADKFTRLVVKLGWIPDPYANEKKGNEKQAGLAAAQVADSNARTFDVTLIADHKLVKNSNFESFLSGVYS